MAVKKVKRWADGMRRVWRMVKSEWDEDLVQRIWHGWLVNPDGSQLYGWHIQFKIGEPITLGRTISEVEQFVIERQQIKERRLPKPVQIHHSTWTQIKNETHAKSIISMMRRLGWQGIEYGYSDDIEFKDTWQMQIFDADFKECLAELETINERV